MLSRKAQTQVISAILITGIAVGVVSIAYIWGVPLIQKSQVSTQITNAENLMNTIEKEIANIIQTGGQRSILLSLDGNLIVDQDANSIVYSLTTKGANVANDWVPLNDDNYFGVIDTAQNQSAGIVGEDKSGVIIAKTTPAGNQFITTYRLAYRQLVDLETSAGYLVQIKSAGNNLAGTGSHYLIIKKEEPYVASEKSKLGGTLTVTKISVTIS